jgi:hypothetical protein
LLSSDELCLGRYWGGTDVLLEDVGEPLTGTTAAMTISLSTNRDMKDVFDHYTTEQDDYAFAKTHVLVNLSRTGTERLVSRSQARRLLARFQQFRELCLDFSDVDLIGPAFADEIFRVFTTENAGYRVTWMNASASVERMIKRALAQAARPEEPGSRP